MRATSAARRLARVLAERSAELGRLEPAHLAARLTLVSLLLAPIGGWDLRAWVLVLAAAGLLAPRLAEWAPFWLALSGLAALRVVADWPLSDNHAYLLAIWCLALGLAFAGGAPRQDLATSARWLVAIAFALAVLQKAVVSPDYLDGTFFRWLLAEDGRFEELGRLLGRGELELASTRALLEAVPGEDLLSGARFVETPALRAAAHVLTWATLGVEAAVALVFLAPGRRLASARDALLLLFLSLIHI